MSRPDYLRDPDEIYRASRALALIETDLRWVPEDLVEVAMRLVHASADPSLVRDIRASAGVAAAGRAALDGGAAVMCDSEMVAHGVIRAALPAENPVICTLNDDTVPALAKRLGTTRSAAALELWGKALGGASGGFTSGRQEIIDLLRQRSRPYLFSNTVSPIVAKASIAVIDLLSETTALRDKLEANTRRFRSGMSEAGFDIKPGDHPIVPIMLYNAKLSQDIARDLYDEGIYVIGFYFPVVAKGLARIRVQLSAGHEFSHIDRAIEAFTKVGGKYDILGKSGEAVVAKYGE